MTYFLLVALGGAAGAMARYGVDRVVVAHLGSALVATAIVNVSGSFVLGLLAGLLGPRSGWPDHVTMLAAVGFPRLVHDLLDPEHGDGDAAGGRATCPGRR